MYPPKEAIQIPESSWGQGGHFWVWQNHLTEWMWPIIHSCEKRITKIVDKYETIPEDKLLHRALNQLAREKGKFKSGNELRFKKKTNPTDDQMRIDFDSLENEL